MTRSQIQVALSLVVVSLVLLAAMLAGQGSTGAAPWSAGRVVAGGVAGLLLMAVLAAVAAGLNDPEDRS